MRNRAFHVLFGPSTRFSVAFQCEQENKRHGRGESSDPSLNNFRIVILKSTSCVVRQVEVDITSDLATRDLP